MIGRKFILVLVGAFALGCGQLEKNPLERGPDGLTEEEVVSCRVKNTTPLGGLYRDEDPTRGGKLEGSSRADFEAPVPTIIAIDYSGSMCPGEKGCKKGTWFMDQKPFADLVSQAIAGSVRPGDPMQAMVFNASPHFIKGPTTDAKEIVQRTTSTEAGGELQVACSGQGYASLSACQQSDMERVLDVAEREFKADKDKDGLQDGVLWIVTDNIIDVAGGGAEKGKRAEAALNAKFYSRLHDDEAWQIAFAHPLHEVDAGQADWLKGSTLMVYQLYYSSHERIGQSEYDQLAIAPNRRFKTDAAVKHFIKYSGHSTARGRPLKFKPDDLDVIRIAFTSKVMCQPGVGIGERFVCQSNLTIENLLEHRNIEPGTKLRFDTSQIDPWFVQDTWFVQDMKLKRLGMAYSIPKNGLKLLSVQNSKDAAESATVADKITFEDGVEGLQVNRMIPAMESLDVRITLGVPGVRVKAWNESTLADHWENSQASLITMVGGLNFLVDDLHSTMAIGDENLYNIYGVAALPKLFANPNTSRLKSSTCLAAAVNNPSIMVTMLVLSGFGLLLALAIGGAVLLRPSYRSVSINGTAQATRIRLSRLGRTTISYGGKDIAKAYLAMNGRERLVAIRPYRMKKVSRGWELRLEDEMTEGITVELTKRAPKGRKTRSSSAY